MQQDKIERFFSLTFRAQLLKVIKDENTALLLGPALGNCYFMMPVDRYMQAGASTFGPHFFWTWREGGDFELVLLCMALSVKTADHAGVCGWGQNVSALLC